MKKLKNPAGVTGAISTSSTSLKGGPRRLAFTRPLIWFRASTLRLVPGREPHLCLPVLHFKPVSGPVSRPALRERSGHKNAIEGMQLRNQTGAMVGAIHRAFH